MLKVNNLSIVKSNKQLFKNLNLTVDSSNILEIVGKNGSGKTSLLKVLAQISLPKEGNHNSNKFNKIYLPATGGMREELTPLKITKFFLNCSEDTAIAALTELGLKAKINTKVSNLSEGQKKRVMMTRIQDHSIRLLLLDEPFNALDKIAKRKFAYMLSLFCSNGGVALIATHIPLKTALENNDIPNAILKRCLPSSVLELNSSLENGWQLHYINDANQTAQKNSQKVGIIKNTTMLSNNRFHTSASNISVVKKHFEREINLLFSKPGDFIWPLVFLWMLVSVIPFGIGYDGGILKNIAAGIIYTGVFLVMTITSSHLFEPEKNSGALEQMITTEKSLSTYCTVKSLLFWVAIGLPLSIVAFPLATIYNMSFYPIVILVLSLSIGSLSLAMMLTLFSALGLMARQAQIVVGLLAFPSIVPILIFGTASVRTVVDGQSPFNLIFVLLGLSVFTLLVFPQICAKLLEISLE